MHVNIPKMVLFVLKNALMENMMLTVNVNPVTKIVLGVVKALKIQWDQMAVIPVKKSLWIQIIGNSNF